MLFIYSFILSSCYIFRELLFCFGVVREGISGVLPTQGVMICVKAALIFPILTTITKICDDPHCIECLNGVGLHRTFDPFVPYQNYSLWQRKLIMTLVIERN